MQLDATTALLGGLRSHEPVSTDSVRVWFSERRALHYSDPRLLLGTFEALMQTGDVSLLRDDRIRIAAIGYASQIRSDVSEFERWVEQSVDATYVITSQGEPALVAVPVRSMDEEVISYLVVSHDDPQVRIGVGHAIVATNNRILYLQRMLEATRRFLESLESALGSEGLED